MALGTVSSRSQVALFTKRLVTRCMSVERSCMNHLGGVVRRPYRITHVGKFFISGAFFIFERISLISSALSNLSISPCRPCCISCIPSSIPSNRCSIRLNPSLINFWSATFSFCAIYCHPGFEKREGRLHHVCTYPQGVRASKSSVDQRCPPTWQVVLYDFEAQFYLTHI